MGSRIKLGHAPALDIEVTQAIIADAVRKDSSHCVVADAVRAHLNFLEEKSLGKIKFSRVAVDLQTIRFSNLTKKERYTYLSPRSTQVALVDFDQGREPNPFTFRLRGGQTTTAGYSAAYNEKRRIAMAKRTLEEKELEKTAVAAINESAKTERAALRKPPSKHTIPAKVGGRPPPVSIGNRRAFGLRALDR